MPQLACRRARGHLRTQQRMVVSLPGLRPSVARAEGLEPAGTAVSTRAAPGRPRRVGRPPAGARAGERVKDYPQLSVRVPPEVKRKLVALSIIDKTPQSRV